jgi:hypothetical protein
MTNNTYKTARVTQLNEGTTRFVESQREEHVGGLTKSQRLSLSTRTPSTDLMNHEAKEK